MPRPRRWTDDQLRDAVARSARMIDVLRHLDLAIGGGALDAVRNRILQLGLDCSHMAKAPTSPKWDADPATIRTSASRTERRTWTDDDLRMAVAGSRSLRGVIISLGLKEGGGQYVLFRRRIQELGLDTSHFTGRGWTTGLKNPTPVRRLPLEEILVESSDYTNTHHLKLRLLREGLLEPACSQCRRTRWQGQAIPLHLDHVNGDRTDNRLENLRLLCPNCHAQTDTYCGRNIGKAASASADTMAAQPGWRNWQDAPDSSPGIFEM